MNSLSLFSLLFTLLILNSCRTELKNSEPKFDLDKIKLKGKIKFLMDNSTLSFYDDKGKESVFEYEILAAFAKSIGLKLEVMVITNQAEFSKLAADRLTPSEKVLWEKINQSSN